MEKLSFEICANGVESALAAQEAGADRVEFCAGIPEGGTTPSYGEIAQARLLLKATRLHVIIRPRGGDFSYSQLELDRMAMDIDVCRDLGADGVVIGCLTPEGDVDMSACRMLMSHAGKMSVTFHRAFDRCPQPERAMEDIISLGCSRILTSGQQPTAEKGIPMLRHLQELADGRIIIMAGCGVNEDNIARIRQETGVTEYHFSAREGVPSPCSYMHAAVYMGREDAHEDLRPLTTARRVRTTIEACKLANNE